METNNHNTLTEALDRLEQAVLSYKKFVRTTRSYQLAIEGVRSYTQRCDRAEAGLLPRVSHRQEGQ
jgi:hypothetical protein